MSAHEIADILRGALTDNTVYAPVGGVADTAADKATTVILEVSSSGRLSTYEVTITAVTR